MAPPMEAQSWTLFEIASQKLHQRSAEGGGGQDALDPVTEPIQASAGSSTSVYIGVGAGTGVLILVLVGVVGSLIWRKRAQRRRRVAGIDHNGTPVRGRRSEEVSEVPQPVSAARFNSLVPLHARAGWGALSSDETVYRSESVRRRDRKRDSISIPPKIRQRTIPLRKMKHLSAIIESPRSRSAKSPSAVQPDVIINAIRPPSPEKSERPMFGRTITKVHPAERDADVFTAPGSPKPDVLPSFAIRSPSTYGAAIANDDRQKAPRSASVGVMLGQSSSTLDLHSKRERSQVHPRSLSLGAPPGCPPSSPVPPLPERSMLRDILSAGSDDRRPVLIPRLSSSSGHSADSSVLVTSPLLTVRDDGSKQLGLPSPSPTVEQLVAEDEGAQLKTVSVMNRQWQNPLITGPRPADEPRLDESRSGSAPALVRPRLERNPWSVRSNMATYSTASDHLDQRLSAASIGSDDAHEHINRLSIPQIGTAARLSVSRVSSSSSIPGISNAGVQKVKVSTPRKSPRHSTVSVDGSPAEREKKPVRPPLGTSATTSALQSISHNTVSMYGTPSRQTSNSTQSSTRSGDGAPFQWDHSMPLMKPSALKGSPNAKGTKGHRRQNCVRISTLTPQILGPPPSRPSSLALMDGIEEEEAEDFRSDAEAGQRFITSHQNRLSLQRQPSASSFSQPINPRVQNLRASLTADSPILSAWTAWHNEQSENRRASGLPSQHSDSQVSQLSVLDMANLPGSRQSSVSALSIPSFPSPSHAPTAVTPKSRDDAAVPGFGLQGPSTEAATLPSSCPSALYASSDGEDEPTDLPSSPPLPVSKTQEYDPAWPMLYIPKRGAREYDPNSPSWPDSAVEDSNDDSKADRSSASYFPFAAPRGLGHRPGSVIVDIEDECLSPCSRPSSTFGHDVPDSPPCSPKTIPQGFRDLFGGTAHTSAVPVSLEQRQEALKEPRLRRSLEKLTSANASAIMATIPEIPPNVGFPSAVPILPPPTAAIDPHATAARSTDRSRAISSASGGEYLRPASGPPITGQAPTAIMVAPPSSASAIDSSPMQPPPLKIHTRDESNGSFRSSISPRGPRSEPSKSVLKNAIALRRMNSDLDRTTRSERRYTHLAREPSPLLPWTASPEIDPSEGFSDLFDFELGDRNQIEEHQTSAGAVADSSSDALYRDDDFARSTLDEMDFRDLDRTIDGALAGLQHGPPSTASLKSRTSVGSWEEGERFWESPGTAIDNKENRRPSGAGAVESERNPSSPVDNLAASMSAGSMWRRGRAGGGYEFGVGGEKSRPNSILQKPRSFYDSDGFLKAEGSL